MICFTPTIKNRDICVYPFFRTDLLGGRIELGQIFLIVLFLDPPDDLSITGYSEGDVLPEGTQRRIKCTAVSGNPLPTLEWFAGDEAIKDAVVDTGASESFVSSEITVKVDRSDNDKVYECRGKNEANPETPVKKSFKMSVEFPPRILTINVDPENPVEGKSAVLTCVTDSSNPNVTMRWRHNGEALPATDSSIKAGPHGGLETTNVLQIDVTTKHVGAVFTCEAEHAPSETTVHNSTILTIKCKYLILNTYFVEYDILLQICFDNL